MNGNYFSSILPMKDVDKISTIRGRVRKFDNNLTFFGMKLTTTEKEKIKNLALHFNTTSTQAVLRAVDMALARYSQVYVVSDRRITADELLAMGKETREKVMKSQMKYVAMDSPIEDGFDIIDD